MSASAEVARHVSAEAGHAGHNMMQQGKPWQLYQYGGKHFATSPQSEVHFASPAAPT